MDLLQHTQPLLVACVKESKGAGSLKWRGKIQLASLQLDPHLAVSFCPQFLPSPHPVMPPVLPLPPTQIPLTDLTALGTGC